MQRRIVEVYHENDGVSGYRMIRDHLVLEGIIYLYPKIFKYMHELGLHSIVRPQKPAYTKVTANKVFVNLVNQKFYAEKTNEVWCTDFTYMPGPNGTMRYNCSILEFYDRSIVATLNSPNITTELAVATLQKALDMHKPGKGIILHSDQGSQFTAKAFNDFCEKKFCTAKHEPCRVSL